MIDDSCLPDGWTWSTFEHICDYVQRGKGPKYTEKNAFPVVNQKSIRWHGIDEEHLKYVDESQWESWDEERFIKEGDILWNSTGTGTIGRACYLTSEQATKAKVVDSHVTIVRTNNLISSKYVFYWIMHPGVQARVSGLYTGSTNQVELSKVMVLATEIPLPPLAEQQQIAAKLDELLAQVDTLKTRLDAIPKILKRFRQSVLAAAVSGKLTEDWRNEYYKESDQSQFEIVLKNRRLMWEHSQIKQKMNGTLTLKNKWQDRYPEPISEIHDPLKLVIPQEIPKIWSLTNLDNVSFLVTGKTPPTDDEENWNGTYSFISPTQVHPDGNILEPVRFVSEKGVKKVPLIPLGSVVIVCIGTIGKVGILDRDAVINQQLNALTPVNGVLNKYLYYWCKTLDKWLQKTSSATVNSAIINKSRLASAPFPLPPLEEQTEIVNRVEQLFTYADQIEQRVKDAQARVNHLTQAILAKAFRGELTAEWRDQNPDLISGANSAEALLAKIKIERARVGKC